MKKRRLGQSDLMVSEVGLGCMSIGTNIPTAKKVIEEAIDLGINYLDTADLYDQGVNEEIIGELIMDKRQDLILATKAGNRFEKGKDGWTWDPSKSHIKKAIKDSLQRLKTDYIDLYQLHGGTIDDPIDETIEAFEELKQEGLIREYGLSSIRPNVIKEYVKRSSIVSIMMQYSLLDRRPEEWFPLLGQHDVSVVVRGAVAKGILTSRPFSTLASKIQANGYLSYTANELKQVREQLADYHTLSINELALNYVLSSNVIASVVTGASRKEQVKENVQAIRADLLPAHILDELKQITKKDIYEQHR
ncbi:aldo/keto reductase [Halalkalibacter hemicellulosilyticus]|uniref:Oxidoreductase n=1 Tax=Halalkalibacter hemicellulosilyticusJCM 9152 TaxID=1236971 RepID=W4QHM0_9BACI|nr:aldo/keto reductase [Halalkalibacter hemicellulosilyticus]GAE31153.1 oxidoreductase [Halalkalibacter hemicellulosilyticusJCM 9152]